MVLKPRVYESLEGTTSWTVPKSSGLMPLRPPGATDEEWQQIQMEFVDTEENVLKAEQMEILLRNQIVEGLEPDSIEELKDPYTEYDERSIHEIFELLIKQKLPRRQSSVGHMPHAPPKIAYPFRLGLGVLVQTPRRH